MSTTLTAFVEHDSVSGVYSVAEWHLGTARPLMDALRSLAKKGWPERRASPWELEGDYHWCCWCTADELFSVSTDEWPPGSDVEFDAMRASLRHLESRGVSTRVLFGTC